jgi:hypothetical protein
MLSDVCLFLAIVVLHPKIMLQGGVALMNSIYEHTGLTSVPDFMLCLLAVSRNDTTVRDCNDFQAKPTIAALAMTFFTPSAIFGCYYTLSGYG